MNTEDPDPDTRIELFDRFDYLVFEEGKTHALVRQWPTMMDEHWYIDSPPKWVGHCLSQITEQGWETVSVTIHRRGIWPFTWEVRTWLFQRRVPCRLEGSHSHPGSMTSRLLPAQNIHRDEDCYP